MEEPKVQHIGNIYGEDTHGGYGGDIFSVDGISRTLAASTSGGGGGMYIKEPAILRLERTEEEKKRRSIEGDVGAKYSSSKTLAPRPDGISNTLTQCQKDNLVIEPHTCAIRTRSYAGQPAKLEIGKNISNALTSVQKDSLIIEPYNNKNE